MKALKSNNMLKIIFIIFIFLNIHIFGNDMEFISEGNHIIPLESSNISIKKERIELKKLDDYDMSVKVEFVFSSDEAGRKMIGFITPNDEYFDDKPPYDPENIKNFKTKVNGKEVKIKTEKMSTFIKKAHFSPNDKNNYLENYKEAYAYYFEADFKKGENVVEHSYTYCGIIYSMNEREYGYVLTTISRWKDKKVDDFEITVDMGDEFFILPYTFWKDERPVNWEIVGEGRKVMKKNRYPYDGVENYHGNAYFKMKKGYVKFSAKNFSPDREFRAVIPSRGYVGADEVIDGHIFSDRLMKIGWNLDFRYPEAIAEAEKLTDFELEIIKNFPFAVHGYEFSRKDLKDYFSKFFWYYPKGKADVPGYEYETRTRIINEILEKRKKRK